MKLRMMVLDKVISHKKEVQLKKLTYEDWKNKLVEECDELKIALDSGDRTEIAEEALDVVQVCIGIIAKIVRKGIRIDLAIFKHNKKLVNRDCKESAIVEFNVVRRS